MIGLGGLAHYNPETTNCKRNPLKVPDGSFILENADAPIGGIEVQQPESMGTAAGRFITVNNVRSVANLYCVAQSNKLGTLLRCPYFMDGILV